MTSDELAALHGKVFTVPRPWSAAEFSALVSDDSIFLRSEPQGFLMGRAIAGEAELLTLAVAPEARRRGIGARLVAGFLAEARLRQAERAFLEVAADNAAAIVLYRSAGFLEAGRRRGYYAAPDGRRIDALVLSCPLL